MACALCWYLKKYLFKSEHAAVSWTCALGFTSSYIQLHPGQILCLLLHGLFPCLLLGSEIEIIFLVGITRLCGEGHQQHWVSQYDY